MKTAFLWVGAAMASLLAGCRTPGLAEARFSLPAAGEPAKVVVRVDEQPIALRFDAQTIDYAEWVPHPVDEAPPSPLEELPPGSRPVGAWLLRVRLRGTGALVPSVYMAQRSGAGLLFSTRRVTGRLEPGAGFDVLADGSVRLSNPAAPPPATGDFLDVPVESK